MVIKYYQTHKEKIRKEARERYKNLSEEEKDKRQKKNNIKSLLKKKKKKGLNIFRNVRRSYLTVEEIII